jgi:hypothetical protein
MDWAGRGKKEEKGTRPLFNGQNLNSIRAIYYEARSFSSQEKDLG